MVQLLFHTLTPSDFVKNVELTSERMWLKLKDSYYMVDKFLVFIRYMTLNIGKL